MSPHAARLFFGCSISFVLGGVAGAFGARTLYGEGDRVDPAPTRPLECPPPPPCPACPPPVDCGELGRIPPSGAGSDGSLWGAGEGDIDAEAGGEPPPPGLPPSVLSLAQAAVEDEVRPCLERLIDPSPGTAVLQLTITVTEGEGRIQDAIVLRATGAASDVAGCLAEAARRAQFSWEGADGQLTFKMPLSVGPR